VKAETIKKEEMAGITSPMNFWDPWGFTTKAGDSQLVYFREAELKHGRIGMLATFGVIVGEAFSPMLGSPDANTPMVELWLKSPPVPYDKFWGAAFVAVAFAELAQMNHKEWGDSSMVGDMGWDPLGLNPKKESEFLSIQNKELNNGRLAMLAMSGIIAQEQVTGAKVIR